jgi:succinyl-diaminopimelate desuccinylase
VTKIDDDVYSGMIPVTDQFDVGIVKKYYQKPIYFAPDSPMVKTFMEIYQENTGDMESGPITIGGGTYARAMKNCLAFGALFPGDPDLMHQRDERLAIDRLELMTKIYADAIYRLTQEDFMLNGEPIGSKPESEEDDDIAEESPSGDIETEGTEANTETE